MRRHNDQGYSLIEVVMTGVIMSFVMVVVLTAVLQVYSSAHRTEDTALVRDQIDQSFRRLDRELRYATWVSAPAKVTNGWYTRYALPKDAEGKYPCRQLLLHNGTLTLFGWNLPDSPPLVGTLLAMGVTADAATGPVLLYAPGATPYASASARTAGVGAAFETQYQQVRLRFDVTAGKVTQPYDSVFTAQNIARGSSAYNDCSKGNPPA